MSKRKQILGLVKRLFMGVVLAHTVHASWLMAETHKTLSLKLKVGLMRSVTVQPNCLAQQ
jgi:hypothetical protein